MHISTNDTNHLSIPLPSEAELTKRACDANSLPLSSIKSVCEKVAWEVHSILLNAAKRGDFGGLITAEAGTAGGVTAALTSFDGSSTYVKGGLAKGVVALSQLLRSSSDSVPSITAELENTVTAFAESHALTHALSVTTSILPNLPNGFEFGIKIGGLQKQFFMPVNATSPSFNEVDSAHHERFERARLVGTLLTLELMKEVVSAEWPTPPSTPLALPHPSSPLTPLLDEVRATNQKAWEALQVILSDRRQTLAVGESFTGGKLRECCSHSNDGNTSQAVSTFYLWYDPMWKVAAGVPPECVTDDRITSTETAELGSMGLLNTVAKEADIALATTGWSNRRPDQGADQFSVALASRCFDSNLDSRSMYVDVTTTKEINPSLEKRALTRELGVTAALTLLADHLLKTSDPTLQGEGLNKMLEAKSRLEGLLNRHTLRKISG
jgi:nicotinamide mononucleotide (NMN) deamidase PncC